MRSDGSGFGSVRGRAMLQQQWLRRKPSHTPFLRQSLPCSPRLCLPSLLADVRLPNSSSWNGPVSATGHAPRERRSASAMYAERAKEQTRAATRKLPHQHDVDVAHIGAGWTGLEVREGSLRGGRGRGGGLGLVEFLEEVVGVVSLQIVPSIKVGPSPL